MRLLHLFVYLESPWRGPDLREPFPVNSTLVGVVSCTKVGFYSIEGRGSGSLPFWAMPQLHNEKRFTSCVRE